MDQVAPSARLSVSEVTTRPWTFEQDVRAYSSAGVNGIGVWREKLHRCGTTVAVELLSTSDVAAANLVGEVALAGRTDAVEWETIRDGMTAIDLAHVLGADVVVMLPWISRGRSVQLMRELTVGALLELAPIAESHGVSIAVEPIRRPYVDYFNDLDEAIDLCREVDSEHVGVLVDTWHLWDQPGLEESLRENIDLVKAVQFSGYRNPTRHEFDRLMPGDGIADNARLLRSLESAGYRGWYDVEIFSDDLWTGPLEEVLSGCRQWFDDVWD